MLSPTSDKDICPLMIDREHLHQNGYLLLRQAVPAGWLDELRATFETGVITPEQWPVPRGHDWRHALINLDPQILTMYRLPALLEVAGALIGEGFFLAQVEGREPLAGGGHQVLHRDLSEQRLGDRVTALVYLDDYGPANGATRIVPGSHRPGERLAPFDFSDESRVVQLAGSAGDVLLFDADLVHGASLNPSGARRRSLLISYCALGLYESHLKTLGLRAIRMDTSERFEPADFV